MKCKPPFTKQQILSWLFILAISFNSSTIFASETIEGTEACEIIFHEGNEEESEINQLEGEEEFEIKEEIVFKPLAAELLQDDTGISVYVSSFSALRDAIGEADSIGRTIYIDDNIMMESNIFVNGSADIVLKSYNDTYKLTLNDGVNGFFTINGDCNLVLENIVLDGENKDYIHSAVRVQGGTLTLGKGSIIKNCIVNHDSAVTGVISADSTVILDGGEIIDNTCNGLATSGTVHIAGTNAEFIMNSGKIGNNTAVPGHGGISAVTGSVTIKGGEISGNTGGAGGGIGLSGTSFTMTGGKITGNTNVNNSGGGIRARGLSAGANFTMTGGEVSYNESGGGGGGIDLNGSNTTAVIKNTIIKGNSTAGGGGGIYAIITNSFLDIRDSEISDNISASHGAGIFASGCRLDIKKTLIAKNRSASGGGGVSGSAMQLTVKESEISHNTAASMGGGIYTNFGTVLLTDNTVINHNTAGYNGGAVAALGTDTSEKKAVLKIEDGVRIINNQVLAKNTANTGSLIQPLGEGGGIYISDTYGELSIDDTVEFQHNSAPNAYFATDADAETKYPHVKFKTLSIGTNPVNNFDIHYYEEEMETEIITVTYEPNGGEGITYAHMAERGAYKLIENESVSRFTKDNYRFAGWALVPGAQSPAYQAGDIYSLKEDVTFYAIWEKDKGAGEGEAGGSDKGYKDSGSGYVAAVSKPTEIQEEEVFLLNREEHYAYIVGYPDNTVRPEAFITREEVTVIFFRLLTEEARNDWMSSDNSFPDMNEERWSNIAVSTMAKGGIVNGYPDGNFRPGSYITRGEVAVIAAKFDSSLYKKEDKFLDITGHWAEEYINRAAQRGWVSGYGDGTFMPNNYITRAEVMALINSVLGRNPQLPENLLEDMTVWQDNLNSENWYYLHVQEATNSHYYIRDENNYEIWTNLRDNIEWSILEQKQLKK